MDALVAQLSQLFKLPLANPILIFSLILFIILTVPLALERMRVPGIIGLIISGIIIGPHGFNILGSSLFVDVFSTIGLLYIMFMAGLDLNLIEFKANRNKSLIFGLLTFFIPLAIGFPVCYYLLGMDFYESFLVASIFATHTLVTYPIVSKFGVTKDLSVAITVGGTILTDTAVLVVLAVIIGAHAGDLTQTFWFRLAISVTLFCAFVFIFVPRIGAWFFATLDQHKHSHYVFVLAIVFLCAFLADIAGLEGIIGAFAAGLALNKLIPNSSALMNRIEFIGNSLFIPFFLISVGMLVDMRVIFSGPMALLDAAALTITAFAGKYIAAHATQRVFSLSSNQGNLIFGLSSAHAAATLAVVLVGLRQGIVDNTVLNAIVIIILASCMAASFITEKYARALAHDLAKATDTDVPASAKMEQILIPLSQTTRVESLLRFAVLIKDKDSTSPLSLLNVVPNTEEAELKIASVKKSMEGFLAEATAAEIDVNVTATIDQSVAHGIARSAREISADLILMGWPTESGMLPSALDSRLREVLPRSRKTIFICSLQRPIAQHAGLLVVAPAWAETEAGFALWVVKLVKLSTELSAPIRFYGVAATYKAIQQMAKERKLTLNAEFIEFDDWEDFFIVTRSMTEADLIVVIAARRGCRSYNPHLDKLPTKLGKHLAQFNKILIYPEHEHNGGPPSSF